jgi:hypothetical protein
MTRNRPVRIEPFNPLDKRNLGESVAEALLEQEISSIPPQPFIGAGIYAVYYVGDLETYRKVSDLNRDDKYMWPIYVGKAVPKGARKGGYGLGVDPGTVLYQRLAEHANSIDATDDLSLGDFCCRFLVVEDIWIPLAESLLVEMYRPAWNSFLDGFGNHDPGKGRYNQRRSKWDELHPGRHWAYKLQPNDQVSKEIHEATVEYLIVASTRINPEESGS